MDRWIGAWLIGLAIVGNAWAQDRDNNALDKGETRDLKIVCYYSNWAVYRPGLAKFSPENINPYLCTHIIYAFASLSEEFQIQPFDPYNDMEQGNYRSFVSLKSYNPNLKTMIAVGGWNEGSRRFSRLVESADHRRTFVSSVLVFLREQGFDGIDLDWEYPAFREGGNHTTDKGGYAKLVKELRQAIDEEKFSPEKERLILSVAVPATKDYIDQGFDVSEISRHAHFLNLLTYDYHSAYEQETHHHAPLYPPAGLDPKDDRNQLNVAWTVDYYISLGAPSHKLVIGIPMYGRSYTLSNPQLANGYDAPANAPGEEGAATREKGYLAFYEICQKVKEDEWEVEGPSPQLVGPYAYKKDQWVGFDDEDMVFNKARYIMEKGLGGAMVWTLDNDDFRGLCTGEQSPLVNTLRDVLLNANLIEGSSSQRSVARSAGPQPRAAAVRFDDELGDEDGEEPSTEAPRRRNTLRRLVQNRQNERNRQSSSRALNTDENEVSPVPFTTPAPPATPDPGVAFECQDEGFFNNPRDCKKYFWCLDSGPANLGVVAHAFTCPSGLHFNSKSESCDYPSNVVCPVGSIGASPVKPTPKTPRPRTRSTTTTTTTTTETPTTTTEEPEEDIDDATKATPNSGENVAELLRLLQAIGGVERLQSILGSQEQASSIRNQNTVKPTLPQYVTPKRSSVDEFEHRTTSSPASPPKRQPQFQPELFLDPYDFEGSEDIEPDVEDVIEDFPFQYNTPPRGSSVQPEVVYLNEADNEAAKLTPEVLSYEVPLRQSSPASTSTTTTTQAPPKGPYRTPIRVQVGRVVRVQNGTPAATPGNNIVDAGRRRMLVRVRPVSANRTTIDEEARSTIEEPVSEVTGRAVSRDERRLSGSTLLATRANPLPAATSRSGSGETRVAVRRRPGEGSAVEESMRTGNQGVRLVARRPNAIPETDRGNYVTVRRRLTTPEITTAPATTPTPTTTTTTPTPVEPEPVVAVNNSPIDGSDEEYDEEYEYYDYEDETTTSTTTSTTSTTTTTTKRPNVRLPANRRRFTTASPQSLISSSPKLSSSRPSTSVPKSTSAPSTARGSNRRGPAAASQPSSTTNRPQTTSSPSIPEGPPVEVRSDNDVDCFRRGVFIHPTECSKFVVCAPASRNAGQQALKGRVLHCPANQIYLVDIGRCMKGDRTKCQKL